MFLIQEEIKKVLKKDKDELFFEKDYDPEEAKKQFVKKLKSIADRYKKRDSEQ